MPQSVWWMRTISRVPRQSLADDQGTDLVLGDHASGISDDVGVALTEPEQSVGVQPCIHAGHDCHVPPGWHGQMALVKRGGVGTGVLEKVIGNVHQGSFRVVAGQ